MGTVIVLFLAGLLILFGVLIKYFKAYDLIAGYNTAPPEIKKQVDKKGLGNLVGNGLFLLALIMVSGHVARGKGLIWVEPVSWALFLGVVIYIVVRAQSFTPVQNRRNTLSILIGSLVFVMAIAAFVVSSALKPSVTVDNQEIKISGLYGMSIPLSEVNSIELKDSIPEIITKSNGLGFGAIYKGDFVLKGIGRARLFLRSSEGPFIIVQTKNYPAIINYSDREETVNIYNMLKDLRPDVK